jgi:DNA-binding NtrC family response regulator
VHVEGQRGQWRGEAGRVMPESMGDAERMMIYSALKKTDGNRTLAAVRLGISRRTLQRKLKEYGEVGEKAKPDPAGT